MKAFIAKIIGFILFAIIGYIALVVLWGELMPSDYLKKNLGYRLGGYGHTFSKMKDARNTKDVEILVFGSSHAYRGFDPAIFEAKGISMFNLGSNSQTPLQSELLLKRYCDQMNPSLVIFEVYPNTYAIDGVESSMDVFSNDHPDWNSLVLGWRQRHFRATNTLIYAGYRYLIRSEQENFNEPIRKKDDEYMGKGYVKKDLKNNPFIPHKSISWEFDKKQFEALSRCIKYLKTREIKYELVQAPITSAYRNSITNNDEFDLKISKYGSYRDFNKLIQLNDTTDFYDYHHLNHRGVQKFNSALIEHLNLN